MKRRLLHLCSVGLIATAGALLPAQRVQAEGGVMPPKAQSHGMSYGEWSAAFWQWLYSLPADQHPLFDTADCSEGQAGNVWFLGGTFTVVEEDGVFIGEAERDCTVPAGTALFFPIINAECNTVEDPAATEEDLRACAVDLIDHVVFVEAEIDGVPVPDLDLFRFESPTFEFGPLPENNVLGVDAGTVATSVSDGYYLMLAPLSNGEHELHFTGGVLFSVANGDPFDFQFELDITYQLTVDGR